MVSTTRSKSKNNNSTPAKSNSTPVEKGSSVKARTPARRVRNKVASPSLRNPVVFDGDDLDSDEFNFNDEEESVSQSEVPSDTESKGSTVSKRFRLPNNLLQQLGIDIQARGGIQLFHLRGKQALCELCDRRPELYGDRGDKLRKRIGKKVADWKLLSEAEYFDTLRTIGLDDKDIKPTVGSDDRKPAAKQERPESKPTRSSKTIPSTVSVVAESVVTSTNNSVQSASSVVIDTAKQTHKMSTFSNTIRVVVNPNRPECNGPFLVYPVPDFEGKDDGKEYKGYYIIYPTDCRFVEMDDETTWISAKLSSNYKTIIVRVPAWPFALYPKGKHSGNLYKTLLNQLDGPVKKSLNHAHSAFDTEDHMQIEARKWKYYELDFSQIPGLGVLSTKELSGPTEENGEMDFDFLTLPAAWDKNGTILREEEYMGWRVADLDDKGGRKVKRTNKATSKIAQKRLEAKQKAAQSSSMKQAATTTTSPSRTMAVPGSKTKVALPDSVGSTSVVPVVPSSNVFNFNVDVNAIKTRMENETEEDAMSESDLLAESGGGDSFMSTLDKTIEHLEKEHEAMEEDNPGKRTQEDMKEEDKGDDDYGWWKLKKKSS